MALEERVKDIISYCPHYYDIVNMPFNEDDIVSKKLISEFCEEIFNISNNNMGTVNRLKVLDLVIYEYTLKDSFYYYAKESFSNNANLVDLNYDSILYKVVDVFRDYTISKVKKDNNEEPRWL